MSTEAQESAVIATDADLERFDDMLENPLGKGREAWVTLFTGEILSLFRNVTSQVHLDRQNEHDTQVRRHNQRSRLGKWFEKKILGWTPPKVPSLNEILIDIRKHCEESRTRLAFLKQNPSFAGREDIFPVITKMERVLKFFPKDNAS